MLLTMQGTLVKNIDGISKTRDSIHNLKEYQKYQNSFVIFDADSNFEHIYQMFSSVAISEINILIRVSTFMFLILPVYEWWILCTKYSSFKYYSNVNLL